MAENELVVQTEVPDFFALVSEDGTDSKAKRQGFLCNFDPREAEHRDLLFLCQGQPDTKTDERPDEWTIRWWVVQRVELTDERTGEVVEALRTCLVAPDKRVLASMATGVVQSLRTLCAVTGRVGVFDPPVRIKLRYSRTRKGRLWIDFVPLA